MIESNSWTKTIEFERRELFDRWSWQRMSIIPGNGSYPVEPITFAKEDRRFKPKVNSPARVSINASRSTPYDYDIFLNLTPAEPIQTGAALLHYDR